MIIPRWFAVPLLATPLLVSAVPARAAATAETAAALQAQIRTWIADLIGPGIDLGSHQVMVAPEGDAYRFQLPLAGPVGDSGWKITADPITVIARPTDKGAWTIQSFTQPNPFRFEGKAGANGLPVSRGYELARQESHGQFDPTLATATSLDSTIEGYHATTSGAEGEHDTSFVRATKHSGWEPTGDGRVNMFTSGRAEGFRMSANLAAKPMPIEIGVGAMSGELRMDRFDFGRLGSAVRTVRDMVPMAMAMSAAATAARQGREAQQAGQAQNGKQATPPKEVTAPPARPLTAEDRARLHGLVVDLNNLFSTLREEFRVEHVQFDLGGQSASLEGLTFAASAAAPGGKLDFSFTLMLDGLDTPMLPPGPLRDYLPRRVALTPHITGVPMDDVVALVLRAIDNKDAPPPQAEIIGLLAKGPLKVGLENVVIDLGDVGLKGDGALTITGATPADIKGGARIVATGLDGLIQRANTVPELKSAAPVLILVKGLGEQKGDTVTWNITYADGRTLVNGTDLKALMPQQPQQPPRPHPTPNRPQGGRTP